MNPGASGPAGDRSGVDLVLAVGNPLRGDDGVAWRLAQAVPAHQPGLRLACCQQLLPELAAELIGVQRLLVIDAWQAPPGSQACLLPLGPAAEADQELHGGPDPAKASPSRQPRPGDLEQALLRSEQGLSSSHHLDPVTLLALAEHLYGARPRAWQLLVPAHAFPHGDRLSPELGAQLPRARRLLAGWLADAAPSPLLDATGLPAREAADA